MSKTVDYSGCALECIRSNKERECIKTVKGVCPYCEAIAGEANERIQHLESRLAQVERERDALICNYIPQTCDTCKYSLCFSFDNPCNTCDHLYRFNAVERGDTDRWEFVGVCAENTEEG